MKRSSAIVSSVALVIALSSCLPAQVADPASSAASTEATAVAGPVERMGATPLIVPGVRVDGIAALRQPLPAATVETASTSADLGRVTRLTFRNPAGAILHDIEVCKANGQVRGVYLRNAPENADYVTTDGVSFSSSEEDVRRILGEPDTVVANPESMFDILNYATAVETTLTVIYARSDKGQPLFIGIWDTTCG